MDKSFSGTLVFPSKSKNNIKNGNTHTNVCQEIQKINVNRRKSYFIPSQFPKITKVS